MQKDWFKSKTFLAFLVAAVPSFALIAAAMLTHAEVSVINTLVIVLGGGVMIASSALISVQGMHDVKVGQLEAANQLVAAVAK